MDAQRSNAQWAASVKSIGESLRTATPIMNKASEQALRLGFSDEEARDSLSRLTLATHSSRQATQLLSSAEDLARVKHISLTTASNTMQLALTGSQRAAKQLGIIVQPVTTNLDKLTAAHKASGTEATKAEIAHAKILDKFATGQQVIGQVSEKLHGQAKAYADTAAGGMEVFRARLDEVFENIGGKLLPVMNNVVGWINTHWPEINAVVTAVAQGIGFAITNVIGPALRLLIQGVTLIVDYVKAHWPEIQRVATTVFEAVRSIISGVVAVATALWERFGSTILSTATRYFHAAEAIIKGVVGVISGVFALVGDLVHGRWGQVWADLKTIVSNAFSVLWTFLGTIPATILGFGIGIGKALLQGIGQGIENAWEWVKSKIDALVDKIPKWLRGPLGISSPSKVTMEIGQQVAEGLILGMLNGTATMPDKLSDRIKQAIDAAVKQAQQAQQRFQAAFGQATSIIDQAFSAIGAGTKTKAENALDKLVSKHDAEEFQANLRSARSSVEDAKRAVQDYIAQASAPDAEATDPAKLAELRAAVVSSQKQLDDLLYQQRLAKAQQAAEQSRKEADARNAVRQGELDKALAKLQEHWSKAGVSTAEAHEELLKVMRRFGVNFAAVGASMGTAWIEGLRGALNAAAAGGGSLQDVIRDAANRIGVPRAAAGGIVTRPTLLLAGEAGPEAIVPLGRGARGWGGATTININVSGFIGSERQLADAVNAALYRKQQTGAVLGLA